MEASPAKGRGTARSANPVLGGGGRFPRSRSLLLRRVAAYIGAGALVTYLALDGAGYDLVIRQRVALVVCALVAIGFALGVLPRGRVSRLGLVPAVAIGGLLVWMLLSLSWTASDERTVVEIARVAGYASMMALALSALNRHSFSAAAAGLSVAALMIAGLAVASRLYPSLFPGATDVAVRFRTDRLDFPLDYWNAVAAWGAMSCAIGLAWSAHARLALVRAISLGAVPIAGLAVYLSYSRGGVLASIAALIAVLVLSRNRWTAFVHVLAAASGTAIAILVVREHRAIAEATGGAGGGAVALALVGAALLCAGAVFLTSIMQADRARLPRETARWAVPSSAAALAVVLAVAGSGPISDAWDEFRSEDAPARGADPAERLTTAGGNRNDIWGSAIDAFEAHPVAGIGPGTFEFWWQRRGDDPEYVVDAHSLYLEQLAELGLPGALLLVGFLGGSLALALNARRSITAPDDLGASVAMCSAFAVFLVSAGVDWMWEETAVTALALGGIAIAAAGGSSRRRRRDRAGKLGRRVVRPAIVAAAILAGATQIPGLVSNQRVRASEAALANGDVSGARVIAERAIDAEPWAATPHAQLALVEREAERLAKAREEIEVALDKEPENWRWPLVLAPIQARTGDRKRAVETFRFGRKLAPHLDFYSPLSGFGQQVYSVEQLEAILLRKQARAAERAE